MSDYTRRSYNLRPSLEWVSRPDLRVSVHPFAAANLPTEFVFGEDEPIDDQLQIGSCTANMMDEILHYMQELMGLTPIQISRLWQYWQERNFEGTTATDAGATIADTMRVARDLGFFAESQYPYNTPNFAVAPPAELMTLAGKNKNLIITTMLQTDQATQKTFMWNNGDKPLPIGYGFAVYPQYESIGLDGLIAMPNGQALGGHANSLWGWSDSRQCWRVHNVWNTNWGDHGRAWIPYSYPRWDVWGVAPKVTPPTPPEPTPTETLEQRFLRERGKIIRVDQDIVFEKVDPATGRNYHWPYRGVSE